MKIKMFMVLLCAVVYCNSSFAQEADIKIKKIDSVRKEKLKNLKINNGGYVGVGGKQQQAQKKMLNEPLKNDSNKKKISVVHGTFVGVGKKSVTNKSAEQKGDSFKITTAKLKQEKKRIIINPNESQYVGVKPKNKKTDKKEKFPN